MPILLKKPQQKNDELAELRKWMLDVWNILNNTPHLRGDGNRLLVTQSAQGSVLKLLEDDYKKNFSFFVESQEGGTFSKNKDFFINGGTVSKPGLDFEVTGIKENLDSKYLYLTIYNLNAEEAAEIPDGEDSTQQDIDEEEENFFAKFEKKDDLVNTAIEEDKLSILLGFQIGGIWSQKYTGDVYISGIGEPLPMRVVRITNIISANEYTGFLQSSSDPTTREDTGSEITIKPVQLLSASLSTGSFHTAYEEGGIYFIANLAVFN